MITREEAWTACRGHLSMKEKELHKMLADLNEGLQSETKSTAGDKHETGRAMMQLEKEKLGKQLEDLSAQRKALEFLQNTKAGNEVRPGSLIQTNNGLLYLSIGLGKIESSKENFIALSPQSPLGKLLVGKKNGETINFNGMAYTIMDLN